MPWGAAAAAVTSLVGASMQAKAAKSAAEMQAAAADRAAQQQREMFDIQNEQQRPYREAGYGALTNIKDMLPYFTKQPTAEDVLAMPGAQFGLKQAVESGRQGLNVGGGGSNMTRGAIKFATDYGTNIALPGYLGMRTGIYNTLSNLAGLGQKSQESIGNLASGVAGNIGQLGVGAAGALGAGNIGAANAYAGAGQGIGNAGMLYQMMNRNPSLTPYQQGQQASNQYGYQNVYGPGGGGTMPTQSQVNSIQELGF
jgi:hypothetical protein